MRGLSPWEDWFSSTIRRNRLSFFISTILLVLVLVVAVLVIAFFSRTRIGLTVFQIAFAILAAIGFYFLTAQRLRDMNVTGWLALLWIPAGLMDRTLYGAASLTFWIVLLAVPGTLGANRYGADPVTPRNGDRARGLEETFR